MEFSNVVDIVVILLSIVLCVIISLIANRKQKITSENYFLADRNMSMIPVALSAFATMVNANNITVNIGQSFTDGFQFALIPVTFFLTRIFVVYFMVPVFHNMPYNSVYEYTEKRFDKHLKIVTSVLFILMNVVLNSAGLYIPAITVTTVTGISYWITLTTAGLICTLYCVIGGLKAVIWTDVFQSTIIFGSIIMVSIFAYIDVGGVRNAWSITFVGKLFQHFQFKEDLNNNYTVTSIIINAFVASISGTIVSQACAQRYLCVKDYKTAKKAGLISVGLSVLFMSIVIFTSVAVFAALTNCNPIDQPDSPVKMPIQIYIFVAEKLFKGIPGALGLVLAGLISASLSTISSSINSLASVIMEDHILVLKPSLRKSERKKVLLSKIITGLSGVVIVACGLLVPKLGGFVQVTLLAGGALAGPLGGLTFIAFFCRKNSLKACKISLLVTFVFGLWLCFGSAMYYPHRNQFKHFDDATCLNYTMQFNQTDVITSNQTTNQTESSIFGISVFWICPLSALISFILSKLLGLILEESSADIRLLSPLILTAEEKKQILKMKSEKLEAILLSEINQ